MGRPRKRIHHRGTEDTEKAKTERKRENIDMSPGLVILSLLALSLFLSVFAFSVSSVPLW
jgi:hypothetical protein